MPAITHAQQPPVVVSCSRSLLSADNVVWQCLLWRKYTTTMLFLCVDPIIMNSDESNQLV